MRTAEVDQNLLSLNTDSIVWFAGTDRETPDPGPLANPLELLPPDPKVWDTILKCSGRSSTTLKGAVVAQGKENALDINNKSSFLSFAGEWGKVGGDGEQVITIKGGSHDVRISGIVYSHGNRCDVDLGNWSDQSFDTTFNIDLSGLFRFDGGKITVVLGRVDKPFHSLFGLSPNIQLSSDCRILFWRSIGEQVYWWVKWVAVKMGIIK
jgi:hypothetical protein